jgi:hypothetical protein
MGGGLIQLVAYGAQDIYLTGNPQITFFKIVYRRHTNFAVESIEQTFDGNVKLGSKVSCTIARNGDLVHRLYLELDVNNTQDIAEQIYLILQFIDYIEVEIGGQVIDKHYAEWIAIWLDLTSNYDQLIQTLYLAERGYNPDKTRLRIPLQFWFCRNPGLALPLIALQYHEVKIHIQFAKQIVMSSGSTPSLQIADARLWADYIFIDTDERRRFAQVSHEYLIEQVQFSNDLAVPQNATSVQHELRFNHPVKELIWIVGLNDYAPFTDYIQCSSALLQLNGQDRFKRRDGDYFTRVQRYQHHTGAGHFIMRYGTGSNLSNISYGLEFIHIYSFALKPEEHQPSGTCNFSRIDNAVLNLEFQASPGYGYVGNLPGSSTTLRVYAVNYNVLRIMSGMGGLAYSN